MVVNSSTFNFKDVVHDMVESCVFGRQGYAEAAYEVIPKVAKEAAAKLRKTSPKRQGGGDYAKGWAYEAEKGRLRSVAKVYGKYGTYQLAHLLERPHAKRGGGRTNPIVHIEPVEQWAMNEAYDRIMDKLEGVY